MSSTTILSGGPELLRGSGYQMIEFLGSGGFGCVVRARNVATGEIVAIKMLPLGAKIAGNAGYVKRELLNHKQLAHEHVVRFRQAFLTPSHLCIVMECAVGGNLLKYLIEHRVVTGRGFTEDDARWFFWQLIVALDYCHSKDTCTRDIKLENTLLKDKYQIDDGQQKLMLRPIIMLCDFGFSKNSITDSAANSNVGTIHYKAPEVLKCGTKESSDDKQPYNGKAADIWSCGVLLYAMLFRSYPFDRQGDKAQDKAQGIAQRILEMDFKIPDNIPYRDPGRPEIPLSAECRDLLLHMICEHPEERITVQQIYHHPWFLQGCPPEVLTFNQDHIRDVHPDLQSNEELEYLVKQACTPSVPRTS